MSAPKPITWNEAAYLAGNMIEDAYDFEREVAGKRGTLSPAGSVEWLHQLRDDVDAFIKDHFEGHGGGSLVFNAPTRPAWQHLINLGVDAFGFMGAYERPLVDDIVPMVCKKQHDYGPENILRFGVKGLCVRLHDKVARLENLNGRGNETAEHESVHDSWADVIGYAIVGIMLERGWFTLPLEADVDVSS